MFEKRFKSDNVEIWFEDEVLIAKFNSKFIDLAVVKEGLDARREITSGKEVLLVSDLSEVKSVNKEARDYMSKDISFEDLIACAVLVNSEYQRLIINTFMLINRPKIPMRFFTSKEKAISWLKTC